MVSLHLFMMVDTIVLEDYVILEAVSSPRHRIATGCSQRWRGPCVMGEKDSQVNGTSLADTHAVL